MGYLDGFAVTLRKWAGVHTETGRRLTVQYPDQTRPKPERFHGRHVLNRYEDGMEKCIGCELCAGVCPAGCIYVRGRDNDPEDPTSPGERYGFVYEINYLRCIHCDLCVEACPTEAITETKLFEFAFTDRADAIYTKDELLVDDAGSPRRLPWENWDGGFDPAEDTSGWMRATSPSGDSDFEGLVAWSGELGYGVRAPERGQSSSPQSGRPPLAAAQASPGPVVAEPEVTEPESEPQPEPEPELPAAIEPEPEPAPEPEPPAAIEPEPEPAPVEAAATRPEVQPAEFDDREGGPVPATKAPAPAAVEPEPEPEPAVEAEPEPEVEPAPEPEPDGPRPVMFDLGPEDPAPEPPKRGRRGRRGDR